MFEVEQKALGKFNFLLTIIFTLRLLEEHYYTANTNTYASCLSVVFEGHGSLMTTAKHSKALYRIMMYTHKQQTFVYHNKTLVVGNF